MRIYYVPGTVVKPFPCSELVVGSRQSLIWKPVCPTQTLAHKHYSARPEPLRTTWRNIWDFWESPVAKSAQVSLINCNKKPKFTRITVYIWASMSDELRWEVGSRVLNSCFLAKQDCKSMHVNGISGLLLNLQNQGPVGCIFSGRKYHAVFSASLWVPGRDLMRPIGHPALCSWNSVPIECLWKHVFLICQNWFGQKENCSLICLKKQN